MVERNHTLNRTENDFSDIKQYYEYHSQAKQIFFTTRTVLLILGVVGNIFSLIVWNKGRRCKSRECCFYFKILALSDILVLIVCTEFHYGQHITSQESWNCVVIAIGKFAMLFGTQISPWIIVALSVERTIRILFLLKCSGTSTTKWTLISLGSVVLTLFILQCICTYLEINNSYFLEGLCYMYQVAATYHILKIEELMITWGLSILPFTFIIICNVCILVKLLYMKRTRLATGSRQRERRFHTFTVLTVATGLLHCCSVIPIMLYIISAYQNLIYNHDPLSIFSHHRNSVNSVVWDYLPETTIFLNNSLNFYVYCLFGRDFRDDLKDVLRTCFRRGSSAGSGNGVQRV